MTETRVETGTWRTDFYIPGLGDAGRIRKGGFRTKREAQDYKRNILQQHEDGRAVDERAAKSTSVADLWVKFRQHVELNGLKGSRKPRPKTMANYDFKYRNYIEQDWQYTLVSNITRERCQTWLSDMTTAAGKPVSNDARADGAALFRNMLDYALNQGWLAYNPMTDRAGKALPTPAVEERRPNVYLTLRQLIRLSSLMKQAESMVLTAGLTGLRRKEIIGAKVIDFDLRAPASVFIPAERSKTGVAREVPLPEQVASRLLDDGMASRDGDAPAFPATQGGHWSPSYLGKVFRPAAELAMNSFATLQTALNMQPELMTITFDEQRQRIAIYGPRTEQAVRDFQQAHGLEATGIADADVWDALALADLSPVTLSYSADLEPDRDMPARPVFHDLRHTAVSLAIQAGVSIKMVQQMAGHTSATVTLDVYGHLYPEDTRTAADAMSLLLQDVLPS